MSRRVCRLPKSRQQLASRLHLCYLPSGSLCSKDLRRLPGTSPRKHCGRRWDVGESWGLLAWHSAAVVDAGVVPVSDRLDHGRQPVAPRITSSVAEAMARPHFMFIKWSYARDLLNSGSDFFLVQVAGAVVYSSDNVVVSHYTMEGR